MTPRTSTTISISDWTSISKGSKLGDEESVVQGKEHRDIAAAQTLHPILIYPCAIHSHNYCAEDLDLFSNPGERIKIIVGTVPFQTIFLIHKRILCHHSGYFKSALNDGNGVRFIEAEKGEFEWPDDDPDVVRHWVRWIYSCSSCRLWKIYDREHDCPHPSPHINPLDAEEDPASFCGPKVEPEHAYVFGDRILSPEYCRAALAAFIQHIHQMEPERVIWTYENTLERSPLHRFVRNWLAYQKFTLEKATAPREQDVEAIEAYTHIFTTLEGWSSLDPRKLYMEHWYEECSSPVHGPCEHRRRLLKLQQYYREEGNWATSCRRRQRRQRWAQVLWINIFVWYLCVTSMMILAPFIFAKDREGLISYQSKILGVISSVFALLGVCTWGDIVPYVSVLTGLMTFASAVFSTQQAARCLHAEIAGMCKLETGFASVEMLYVVVTAGVIYGLVHNDAEGEVIHLETRQNLQVIPVDSRISSVDLGNP